MCKLCTLLENSSISAGGRICEPKRSGLSDIGTGLEIPTDTMPAENAWKWATIKGCFNPIEFEAFYANTDERDSHYLGAAD